MAFDLSRKSVAKVTIADIIGNADKGNTLDIPLEEIYPYPNQPFSLYPQARLDELAKSIEKSGLLQPIIVRKIDDNSYQILAGHNRFEAVKNLGWAKIKCIVHENITDEQADLILIDTNLCQRQGLKLSEKALSYAKQKELLKGLDINNSTQLIAEKYGESRKNVQKYLKAATLPFKFLEIADTGKITLNGTNIIANMSEESKEKLLSYSWNKKVSDRCLEELLEMGKICSVDIFNVMSSEKKKPTNIKINTIQANKFKSEEDIQKFLDYCINQESLIDSFYLHL